MPMNQRALGTLPKMCNACRSCTKKSSQPRAAARPCATCAADLEAPGRTAANKIIVLASFPGGGQRKVRLPGPEIPNFAAESEFPPDFHIEAESAFQDECAGGFAGVGAAVNQRTGFTEVAETTTQTYPRRDRSRGKQVHTGGRSDK